MNNSAIKPYEDWVIRNKKFIIDWVKQNDRVRLDDIRNAFNAFERATSNKSKLKAFDGIKNSLHTHEGVAFSDLIKKKYEPAKKYAQELATLKGDGTIESIPRNTTNDKLNKSLKLYDLFNEMSSVLSTLPSKPKDYSYVELDKAFKDNYDYDEMVALANQYNYDWTDKEDRKEFIKTLAEIEQARLKEEAYNPQDAAGVTTKLLYPTAWEYARKNEDKIRTDGPSILGAPLKGVWDMKAPLAMDAATQFTMAEGGSLGKKGLGRTGELLGGLVAAPAMTEYGQVMVNNKPVTDALPDAGAGVALNSIAPSALKGMAYRFYKPNPNPNVAAKALANKYADEYRTMIRLQQEQPYMYTNAQNPSYDKVYEAAKLRYINAQIKQLIKTNPGLSSAEATKLATTGNNLTAAEQYANNAAITKARLDAALTNKNSGHTGVFKRTEKGKEKELSAKEINSSEDPVIQVTPEMQAKERMIYRWKNRPNGSPAANYALAMKKAQNKPITPEDLAAAGYTESALHKLYNSAKHSVVEAPKNLFLNVGAASRLADRRIDAFERNVNLPWNYGESEPEIDWDDTKVKAYKAAYERYKSNEDFYQKPKKPAGLKNETVEKIEEIFGD